MRKTISRIPRPRIVTRSECFRRQPGAMCAVALPRVRGRGVVSVGVVTVTVFVVGVVPASADTGPTWIVNSSSLESSS